jgi:hypothetical protein
MGADWIIVGIVALTLVLVLGAALASKLKKYRFVSPIKKVEPRQRRTKPNRKKRKSLVIRLG